MRELQLLIKPVSCACDLSCRYCFYKDEAGKRAVADHGIMDRETVRAVVEKALAASQTCVFGFQGGEPTLAGLPFYERFTGLVEELRKPGQQVEYTIQTNGIHLDGDWFDFLKEHHFLTGLSMDGVRRSHDENRVDRRGEGTFQRVFDCAMELERRGLPFHVLCVLNGQTAPRAGAIYRFFGRKGFLSQQYIPCLDPLGDPRGEKPWSLTPKMYGEALKTLFDLWFADRVAGRPVYIRQFENYIAMLTGREPEACSMYGRCSMQNVIESDGSVYPCDFYALDPYCMGNIKDPAVDFEGLRRRADEAPFFRDAQKRGDACRRCRWYPLCRGGCRRDCFEEKGVQKNYFCEAYREFFRDCIERMEYLAASLDQGGRGIR